MKYMQNKDFLEKLNIENKYQKYNLDDYIFDISNFGIEKTWNSICKNAINNNTFNDFLNVDNFAQLYEIGLAVVDKNLKKSSGIYYTPFDVSQILAKWFLDIDTYNVCDVGCGTGMLILTYLKLLGYNNSRKLILDKRLYLYDLDRVALNICKTIILVKYGHDLEAFINVINCDFLDKNIILPKNSKVISNPPYSQLKSINSNWNETDVLINTKDLYSAFMEKIFIQSDNCVIISPFSFLSNSKYYSLRKLMSDLGNGFVVSFDNVPGNIFLGKKHGIFNTNTSNSVRPAITVFNKDYNKKGFRISQLIRFKNEERKKLLNNDVLYNLLPETYQVINSSNKIFKKLNNKLEDVFLKWTSSSTKTIRDVLSSSVTNYFIDFPNTCRYFTTGSSKKLNRRGSIKMYFENKEIYDFVYCLTNSSFIYWWWRIFDGAITYPKNLLLDVPLFLDLLSLSDKKFFSNLSLEMQNNEYKYISRKRNAGAIQENIKFPIEYREKINKRLLKILNCDIDYKLFDEIHSNTLNINSHNYILEKEIKTN